MQNDIYEGINKEAFKLVISHCPPAIDPELETKITKLVATALLVGWDSEELIPVLAASDVDHLRQCIRSKTH